MKENAEWKNIWMKEIEKMSEWIKKGKIKEREKDRKTKINK